MGQGPSSNEAYGCVLLCGLANTFPSSTLWSFFFSLPTPTFLKELKTVLISPAEKIRFGN